MVQPLCKTVEQRLTASSCKSTARRGPKGMETHVLTKMSMWTRITARTITPRRENNPHVHRLMRGCANVVQPHPGLPLGHQKGRPYSHYQAGGAWKPYAQCTKPVPEAQGARPHRQVRGRQGPGLRAGEVGVLSAVMEMFWDPMVVVVALLCEYNAIQ